MNWKRLFCIHSYIPTNRTFIGHGTHWGNSPHDIEPIHNYVLTHECIKCGNLKKVTSYAFKNLDDAQPYDSNTEPLFKRN